MKCLHHTDADGKCAAYWVHKRFPVMTADDFIMIDYDLTVDWYSKIEKDEHVYIVDFSLELDDMRKLLNKTKNIVWIDHHKTAIDKYKDFEVDIKGLRYNGIAGCMLTWVYFNKMDDGRIPFDPKMCNEAPWMTKYVHDHDVWKHEYGDETRCFSIGLYGSGDISPLNPIWDRLLNIEEVRKIIEEGSIMIKYRDSIGYNACINNGFEYDIKGHKAFCLNNVFGGSEWFGDIVDKYDMVCSFYFNADTGIWSYSLYSTKIDTSEISKSYGGGGHKLASGFQIKEFIFR